MRDLGPFGVYGRESVPCKHCGESSAIASPQVKWPEGQPGLAT